LGNQAVSVGQTVTWVTIKTGTCDLVAGLAQIVEFSTNAELDVKLVITGLT